MSYYPQAAIEGVERLPDGSFRVTCKDRHLTGSATDRDYYKALDAAREALAVLQGKELLPPS